MRAILMTAVREPLDKFEFASMQLGLWYRRARVEWRTPCSAAAYSRARASGSD
jgi:hypothetical protein